MSRIPHPGSLDLGPIDQVAYVVHDLERTLPHYEAVFGPFDVQEYAMQGATYRGKPADCRLRIAFNRSSSVEIEIIQVLEGETPHTEHLRTHGEGLHHVRFRVDDLDPKLAALEAAGYETIFFQRLGPTIAFAYAQARDGMGTGLIELLQMPA